MTKNEFLILMGVTILFGVVAAYNILRSALNASFYNNPIGRKCRYKFAGKWQNGVVEWANGKYYYIEPTEKKSATDLVHVSKVKPRFF